MFWVQTVRWKAKVNLELVPQISQSSLAFLFLFLFYKKKAYSKISEATVNKLDARFFDKCS